MMKLYLAIALFFSCSIPAFAQTTEEMFNQLDPEAHLHTRTIKLSPIDPVHQFAMPVSDVEVIAPCGDSVNLGYLRNKKGVITTSAIPAKALSAYLQDYITTTYSDQYNTSNGKKLLCLIQYLRIAEGIRERAYVHLKAVTFLSANDQQYQLAYQVDTILVFDNKRDDHFHSTNIARAIDALMTGSDRKELTTAAHTKEEILRIGYRPYQQPIYTATTYNEGVYKTFKEFLNNAPSINNAALAAKYSKWQLFKMEAAVAQDEIIPNWGMYFGGKLYRFYKHLAIPMSKEGQSFILWTTPYLKGMIDPPPATMLDPFTGEVMF